MRQLRTFFIYISFYFSTLFAGCYQNSKLGENRSPLISANDSTITEIKKTVAGNFSSQTKLHLDSTYLQQFFNEHPRFHSDEANVKRFYRSRNFAYAWFDERGLIEQAGNVANRVMNIEQEGIRQELPYRQELDSIMAESQQEVSLKPNPKTELLLTYGYFEFARAAWGGLNDSVTQAMRWFVPRKKIQYSQLLDSLLTQPAGHTKEPVYHQYELLRSFLQRYQELDKKEEWRSIPAKNKGYQLGNKSAEIVRIKQRLQQLGDFTGDKGNRAFNSALVLAVQQFQRRHGLVADGIIGSSTLAALNVPLKSRIQQIIINMERSRWLPIQLEPAYLVVNIPDYTLRVYKNDSLAWSCRVVVGKAVHKTVIFSDQVQYIVFSPYWYLPASIVRNEVVPGLRRNQRYLARHHMEIIGRRNGLPVVRQKPGSRNALGQVKFIFPNRYSIYLHDTPSKSLFRETTRAFSHGCIRVSEPVKLAAHLLSNNPEWNEEKIKAAMEAGKEEKVILKKPIPVYIVYFTAFIDNQGYLNFRQDIYNRDARLATMLLENAQI